MINNPSYAKKPELFHAVALQQQKLAALRLDLGVPKPVRRRPPIAQQRSRGGDPPVSHAAAASHPMRCSECDSDGEDEETVRPALSLAQRMGLEAVPDPALTAQEWAVVAERSKEQGRSKEPCAICLGDFTTDAQVPRFA